MSEDYLVAPGAEVPILKNGRAFYTDGSIKLTYVFQNFILVCVCVEAIP